MPSQLPLDAGEHSVTLFASWGVPKLEQSSAYKYSLAMTAIQKGTPWIKFLILLFLTVR